MLTCQSQRINMFSLSRLHIQRQICLKVWTLAFIYNLSYLSVCLSVSLHTRAQPYIVCSVVTPQLHFQDDFPRVMKRVLSGATVDYMASSYGVGVGFGVVAV